MARAAETAYAIVRDGILSGELSGRLREEELALRAGVSRTPVREALRRLDAEGLVEFLPNRGARVTAWTEQGLDDLYDARALLESHCAGLAAARITSAELDELADLAARMHRLTSKGSRAAAELDELTDLNGRFHRAIATASRNAQLEGLVRGLMDVPLVHRTFQRYTPQRLQASSFQHDELVEALRAKDADWAEALMRAHILAARTTMLMSLRSEDAAPE